MLRCTFIIKNKRGDSLIMKKFMVAAIAAAVVGVAGMAGAATYASGMKVTATDATGFDVKYTLNQPSLATKMIVKNSAGVEVRSLDLGAQTTGTKTTKWNGRDASGGALPNDSYDWFIETTGENVTTPTLVSAPTMPLLTFRNPRGVAIQNNPESPYFGEMYVAEAGINTPVTAVRAGFRATTGNGLFVLSADLEDVTAQGLAAIDGGANWNTASYSSPYRISVDNDDLIWITDFTDAHSGLWSYDRANLAAAPKILWSGTATRNKTGSTAGLWWKNDDDTTACAGNTCYMHFTGSGANKKMYAADEDLLINAIANNFGIMRYDVGTARENFYQHPFNTYFGGNLSGFANMSCQFQDDGFGGFWVGQYRGADSTGVPSLMHFIETEDGKWLRNWRSGSDFTYNFGAYGSYYGAMVVTADGKRLACTGANGQLFIMKVNMNSRTETPVVTLDYAPRFNTHAFSEGYAALNVRQMAFDYAGNLIVQNYVNAGTTEATAQDGMIHIINLPQDNMTKTVKAPASQKMLLPLAKISDWELN